MRVLMVFLTILAGPVMAEDAWVKLETEQQVLEALDDKALRYTTAKQVFYLSGRTLYDAGRPSWGNWRPQGGQYCSEWPPNAGWDCYDLYVSGDGTKVRFVGGAEGTDIAVGQYVPVRE
ncbi:hypothetical protein [Amylibacter sp. IMCC11727]|uniref:hypothetical protein n=1 Tax=Amylibacter sp. IMCC11727 TaxID=3039851 RepID=UPI00244E1304|nr:hypothetical protein [Amylibacter sp. IMCC11727]WGI20704.1 hypothetical protein QBD29_11335 [Amylibacter sp. IMCC11727]